MHARQAVRLRVRLPSMRPCTVGKRAFAVSPGGVMHNFLAAAVFLSIGSVKFSVASEKGDAARFGRRVEDDSRKRLDRQARGGMGARASERVSRRTAAGRECEIACARV